MGSSLTGRSVLQLLAVVLGNFDCLFIVGRMIRSALGSSERDCSRD
jgi:hypothetical protein